MSTNTTPGGDGGYNHQGQQQGQGIDHRDNGRSFAYKLKSSLTQVFKDLGKGNSATVVAGGGAGLGSQVTSKFDHN